MANQVKRVYYGWYCPAIQQLRLDHPTYHALRTRACSSRQIIESPPYSFYLTPDGRKVLVTEITESKTPTYRQLKNGDIFLGEVATYCGRSYSHRDAELAFKNLSTNPCNM
jgi:hypothetical protein